MREQTSRNVKVLFVQEVENYLFKLIDILYLNNYFSYKENAVKYVIDLEKDIKTNIANKVKRRAPSYFNRYGKKLLYCTFKKSKDTHWYVFFNIYHDNSDTIFLIRYISNNHQSAKYLGIM